MDAILADYAERGWLNDRQFARDYARARAAYRRFGRHRITRELRRKGVDEELIRAALAEVFPQEEDERTLIRKRIDRRLRNHEPPYPDKLLRSLYASLLRAGFSSAIIRSELFGRVRSDLAEKLAWLDDEGK